MWCVCFVFFQAEDGIRDLVRSRGLGDVYKRQGRTDADVGGRVVLHPQGGHDHPRQFSGPVVAAQHLSLIHI